MATFTKESLTKTSFHVRDRHFEIIWRVNPRHPHGSTDGDATGAPRIIANNLRDAVKEGRLVLTGKFSGPDKWIDAWGNPDAPQVEIVDCITYSGHVQEGVSDEEVEQALDLLATRIAFYLQSSKTLSSLAQNCWVLSPGERTETTVS